MVVVCFFKKEFEGVVFKFNVLFWCFEQMVDASLVSVSVVDSGSNVF